MFNNSFEACVTKSSSSHSAEGFPMETVGKKFGSRLITES